MKRILFFVALFFLGFVVFHFIKPELAKNIVYDVKHAFDQDTGMLSSLGSNDNAERDAEKTLSKKEDTSENEIEEIDSVEDIKTDGGYAPTVSNSAQEPKDNSSTNSPSETAVATSSEDAQEKMEITKGGTAVKTDSVADDVVDTGNDCADCADMYTKEEVATIAKKVLETEDISRLLDEDTSPKTQEDSIDETKESQDAVRKYSQTTDEDILYRFVANVSYQ